MATIVAKVIGGTPKDLTVGTVGDVKRELGVTGHTAHVNGEPADNDYELSDNEYVSLAPAVKGGLI